MSSSAGVCCRTGGAMLGLTLEREPMPESKQTRRPTEAEARLALRERILELQASNTPMSDAEKAKVAQRDQGCPDVGREPHDQRVLARTELRLPPHVEEDLAALDPCHADRVHEDVVAWTIRSRVEQGLPPHIEDPVVLDMVARMLLETGQRSGPSPRK
jgi:hypothetical protein